MEDREAALSRLEALVPVYPKVHLPGLVMKGYQKPPASPEDCIFAQTTSCVSADLSTRVTPCQFGGRPVCSECGCMASAGLAAVGNYRLGGIVKLSALFHSSKKLGESHRKRFGSGLVTEPPPAEAAFNVIDGS